MEGFYSCWSTSAEMIMQYVGNIRVRQCDQADPPLPGDPSICCDSSTTLDFLRPDCDFPYLPEYYRWGFLFERTYHRPLTWERVKEEIDNRRPFAFSRGRPRSGSHMYVVIGYLEVGTERYLHCVDPAPFEGTDDIIIEFPDYLGAGHGGPSDGYIHGYDDFMIRLEVQP